MGLATLEWHEGKNGTWVARIAFRHNADLDDTRYRRFADVNVFDWVGDKTRKKYKGKVPVQFQPVVYDSELTWHDSLEAAKLYVEAIFALAVDY